MASRSRRNIDTSEILKDLELERAKHSATPCAVERKDDGGARRDESKGENRCRQGQTHIKYERDDVKDGDDRDRPQMADDHANDSQALTGGDHAVQSVCCANQLLVTR